MKENVDLLYLLEGAIYRTLFIFAKITLLLASPFSLK
jgi:hypothetical protein